MVDIQCIIQILAFENTRCPKCTLLPILQFETISYIGDISDVPKPLHFGKTVCFLTSANSHTICPLSASPPHQARRPSPVLRLVLPSKR